MKIIYSFLLVSLLTISFAVPAYAEHQPTIYEYTSIHKGRIISYEFLVTSDTLILRAPVNQFIEMSNGDKDKALEKTKHALMIQFLRIKNKKNAHVKMDLVSIVKDKSTQIETMEVVIIKLTPTNKLKPYVFVDQSPITNKEVEMYINKLLENSLKHPMVDYI